MDTDPSKQRRETAGGWQPSIPLGRSRLQRQGGAPPLSSLLRHPGRTGWLGKPSPDLGRRPARELRGGPFRLQSGWPCQLPHPLRSLRRPSCDNDWRPAWSRGRRRGGRVPTALRRATAQRSTQRTAAPAAAPAGVCPRTPSLFAGGGTRDHGPSGRSTPIGRTPPSAPCWSSAAGVRARCSRNSRGGGRRGLPQKEEAETGRPARRHTATSS